MPLALINKVKEAESASLLGSYKLVLILLSDEQKQRLLPAVSNNDIELINLSLLMAKNLSPLSRVGRERTLESRLEEELSLLDHPFWLDRLDILFEPSLNKDPLQLLKLLSKQQIVIAIWPGTFNADALVYSKPGRQDYKHYPLNKIADVQVVNACGRRS